MNIKTKFVVLILVMLVAFSGLAVFAVASTGSAIHSTVVYQTDMGTDDGGVSSGVPMAGYLNGSGGSSIGG